MSQEASYDVIIIGGAAAGLSAAIYAARRELKTLVVSKDIGGQALLTADIQNYPGINRVAGPELMSLFQKQAEKFGAEFKFEEIIEIKKLGSQNFEVHTENFHLHAKAVILAFGKKPRELDVPGEKDYKGKGVTYCATCDAPLFKGKVVAVVGGGNSAIDAAILSSKIAKKVYLIHRNERLRAEDVMIDKVKNAKNVEMLYNSEVKKVSGDKFLQEIEIENNKNSQSRKLPVDGLIVEIGFVVDSTPVKDLVKLENNQVVIDCLCRTSTKGVMAAGDVTNVPYKQIVISAADGAKAALSAYEYIHGEGSVVGDWGKKK